MRHQSQNKSFSVFAAPGFSPPPCYSQVVSLSSVCHSAAFPKAWEKNRTFKENGAVWAEIREWAGGGTEETRGHPTRGLEAELCDSWGLRKTLALLCGEKSGRRTQFPFLSAGIEPENGHLSQQYVRGQWKRRITVHPGPAMTIPQHFISKPTFWLTLTGRCVISFPTRQSWSFFPHSCGLVHDISAPAIKYKC